MRSDRINYSTLIDKIQNAFCKAFGNDLLFIEKNEATEHMGSFKILYNYLPLQYDIIFESEYGTFTIDIYDNEGAENNLFRIERYDNETKMSNVEKAINILKTVLQKNDFCFYISRHGKIYRKKGEQYSRVKDLKELAGGSLND